MFRQLRAALWVLDEFLNELADIDTREVGRWLNELQYCLVRHPQVSQVDAEADLDFDPITILHRFADDDRLDMRFRQHQIVRFIRDVERARRISLTLHVSAGSSVHAWIQKNPSEAMNASASSSGMITGPKSPGAPQASRRHHST